MIKITVIVPVYNAQNYITKCIDSILAQTYTNFELLLIDDGSTDNSPFICDEYTKKYGNIRTFHQFNSGPAKARNLGILNAIGEYILFVDADDYIAENMLQKMYEAIIDSDADIVVCNYFIVAKNGDTRKVHNDFEGKTYEFAEIRKNVMPCFYSSKIGVISSMWNKIYKSEFVKKYKLTINETLERAEDFWFNFDSFQAAKRIKFIDDALYYYSQANESSIMHKFRPTQYKDWVYNKKELLRRKENLNIDIDYNDFYGSFVYKVVVYLRDLVKMNYDKSCIFEIMRDDFFLMSLDYCVNLPKHVKLICKTIKINKTAAFFC